MQRSKAIVSQALLILKSNLERSGDPLGLKKPYWTQWADGCRLPNAGRTVLMTGRMYQMLPYVVQATAMVDKMKPFLPLLSVNVLRKLAEMGNRVAGETVFRLTARGARRIETKGTTALRGIVRSLRQTGQDPAFLCEREPYSGVLLHDLGLASDVISHVRNVYDQIRRNGVRRIITVDPHTTFMMKTVYPKLVPGFDLEVKHYLEILSSRHEPLAVRAGRQVPDQLVIHDSCVMTRDLGIVTAARRVADRLGIELFEPENTGENTACCGGPVEYAFGDLSGKISSIRMRELAGVCPNILVMCPICMINLMKHEQDLGAKVWDFGELL